MKPERFDLLSLFTVKIYSRIEGELLYKIGTRLRTSNPVEPLQIDAWTREKLALLGELRTDAIQTVAKHAEKAQEAVQEALQTAMNESVSEMEKAVSTALDSLERKRGILNNKLVEILARLEAQAADVMNLTNTTMINSTEQVYRDIVNETAAKVVTGVTTHDKALRETVAKYSQNGIPALRDKNGKRWSAEAHTRMLIRSTSKQVANESQDAVLEEYNVDLIEISSHADARPKCAPYQGRIFSMSGRSVKYPPFDSTSYGEPDGLFGINCRHVKYPYVEGMNTKMFEPYDIAATNERYKESQKQRRLEREIRKAKKQLIAAKGLGDKEAIQAANKRVRQRQQIMREFIAVSGRRRRNDREQVYTG